MGVFAVTPGTFRSKGKNTKRSGSTSRALPASHASGDKAPQGGLLVAKPMAASVRPFVQINDTMPDPPPARVPLPGEGAEAFASWGGPSSLTFTPAIQPVEDVNADGFFGASEGGGFTTAPAQHGQKRQPRRQTPQDNKEMTTTLQEISRQVETVTAYKPGDNTVWVNVQRIKVLRLRQLGGPTFQVNIPGKKVTVNGQDIETEGINVKVEKIGDGQIIVMKLKPPPPPERPKDAT